MKVIDILNLLGRDYESLQSDLTRAQDLTSLLEKDLTKKNHSSSFKLSHHNK
jgi:hypothetical protein